jgi:signal peptidase
MGRVLGGVARRIPGLALTLAAALGTAVLAVSVLAPVLGFRPLIFQSGSMSPTIPVGSLALAHLTNPQDLRVGDIVTVPFAEKYVTHRIVRIGHIGQELVVTLKGDSNRRADPTPYRVPSAVPRVVTSAPAAGTILAWFTRTPGVYVLAAYLVLLMWRLQRHQHRKAAATAAAAMTADTSDGAEDDPSGSATDETADQSWGRFLERIDAMAAA